MPPRDDFIGLSIDALSLDEAMSRIVDLSQGSQFTFVVTPNVDHAIKLSQADVHAAFRYAYSKASLILCDSRILSGLARLFGVTLSLVPGSDLTREMFARALGPGDSVAIIGGDAMMLAELQRRYPGITYHQHVPPMGFINNERARAEAAAFIEDSRAHYVFLAVGSPQGEILAADVVDRGKAIGVGLCIGASIEFIVGIKQRAPLWMQKLSLEWLFRLLSEPRRLWRRYLVEGPAIFALVLRWRMTGRGV